MSRPKRDRIAVLVVLSGRGTIHASVPYVSTLQHRSYPYHRSHSDLEPFIVLGQVPRFFRPQYPSDRIVGISASDAVSLASRKGSPSSNVYGFEREELIQLSKYLLSSLHLDPITDFLFSLENEVTLLQIFTDHPEIPWDWLYSRKKDRFLCEVFGVGITQHQTSRLKEISASRQDDMPTRDELRSSDYCALVVGNSYSQASLAPLPDMEKSLQELTRPIKIAFGKDARNTLVLEDATHRDLSDAICNITSRVRLIYLSGHFDQPGFRCSGNEYFTFGDLAHAVESSQSEKFTEHPIVFLNGCTSGGGTWSGYDQSFMNANLSLAKSFLELGADACVVTSTPVRFTQAHRFSKIFLRSLLTTGDYIAAALRTARMELRAEPDCFEWAVYHLFGDPSYVLVRDD